MGRIRVLDDAVVNRIAAGEVVERPASVLKELLENALDAGARSIDVLLEGGGKRRIRVTDDGEGMDRDDCILAVERHATSKIGRAHPLVGIETFGFRGEALPSIAAVSRFLLRSACRDGEGTEVEIRGGRIAGVREVAAPRGTTVEAAALFFNVPARRKFLRTDATELQRAARVASHIALSVPSLALRLVHEGRALLDLPASRDLAERVGRVLGETEAARLVRVDRTAPGLAVRGFVGRPVDAGARREPFRIFVNGRPVQDRLLSHAIAEAYGNATPKGRFPAVFVFLEIDPARVDVNVHPQKAEVRFVRPSEVHDFVRDAIASAFASSEAVPALRDLRPETAPPAPAPPSPPLAFGSVREPDAADVWRPSPVTVEERDDRKEDSGPPRALAQYLDSYIVAADAEGLVLVDQHVAHERVLFERFLRDAEADRVATQRLLFSVVVELSPDDAVLVEAEAEELRRLGFDLHAFGADAVRIEGIPSIAAALDPVVLFRELLGEASRTRSARAGAESLRHRLVTTAACHAAIKIHHPLRLEGMQALLDDLFRTANPTTCPHGRPILFRLERETIERAFRRR